MPPVIDTDTLETLSDEALFLLALDRIPNWTRIPPEDRTRVARKALGLPPADEPGIY
jgi:hypothetical protein